MNSLQYRSKIVYVFSSFFSLASYLYGAHRHHRLKENMKNEIVKM